jgi:hypothetical protein
MAKDSLGRPKAVFAWLLGACLVLAYWFGCHPSASGPRVSEERLELTVHRSTGVGAEFRLTVRNASDERSFFHEWAVRGIVLTDRGSKRSEFFSLDGVAHDSNIVVKPAMPGSDGLVSLPPRSTWTLPLGVARAMRGRDPGRTTVELEVDLSRERFWSGLNNVLTPDVLDHLWERSVRVPVPYRG